MHNNKTTNGRIEIAQNANTEPQETKATLCTIHVKKKMFGSVILPCPKPLYKSTIATITSAITIPRTTRNTFVLEPISPMHKAKSSPKVIGNSGKVSNMVIAISTCKNVIGVTIQYTTR